jgi:glycerophosphoryl diester phosphodiesterase
VSWLTEHPIAHRGLHDGLAGIPENSMAAFEAACQAGYGIELDAQLSSDGNVMVFHDWTLDRLTQGLGELRDTCREELVGLTLAGTGQRIPTLAEVLRLVAGRVPLLIEIKNRHRHAGKLESAVAELLKSYEGPCAILSYNPFSVAWFARRLPDLLRGQTSTHFPQINTQVPWPVRTALKHMIFNPMSRPDFIVYDHRALTMRSPRRARRRGLPLLAYTIKTEDELVYARQHADNVIFENVRP